jgi:glycine hydroxymethyltransferase
MDEVFGCIERETERQRTTLNLIPSENYASKAVMEATGSVLGNKYSEGYPNKRYYQGNRFVDEIELIAIERAKRLFGAEHVNVQPYSGSPANLAVFFALLEVGDRFMGMKLDMGGHLTHGSPVNFSGTYYKAVPYSVDKETGLLDMDEIRRAALREKPRMIISGYTAYPRTIPFKEFHDIAQEVGACSFADISHIAGLVAAGIHPSPLPFTDVVMTTTHKTLRGPKGTLAEELMGQGLKLVSGGTDNHMMLVDLTPMGIGLGRAAAVALEEAGICLNCNTIPYDPSTPFKPSGLRLGTPILTTVGMKEPEMKQVGEWIAKVIKDRDNPELKQKIKQEVAELCKEFKFY